MKTPTIRECIEAQADVATLLQLVPLPDGEFRYLIETTHRSFPRYVIGRTRDGINASIERMCGLYDTARDAWQQLNQQLNHDETPPRPRRPHEAYGSAASNACLGAP